ncbi:MAG: T9SS type A sorting domain-containing protein [Bacteroidetes bacterium]|nr:T9SS type A sorting domain-containing protein [Bacteroidota bacterium]
MLFPAVTFRTLNENAFFGIIVKGFQEQQNKIDSMVTVITAMQSQMNSCCASNSRTQNQNSNSNQTDVTLSNIPGVVLDQNVPNPFAEQTTITYSLPDNFKKAQVLFYDANGKLIKAVELIGTGKGQLNVFADDLSNGIYTYALVVDGQVMDSKKMVKTK